MKNFIIVTAIAALMTGCFAPKDLQVRVAPMGEEIPETLEQHIYILPQTVLKVEVVYQEVQSVPGPFWEYAEKYLGIAEVIRKRTSQWQIQDVNITTHTELDPAMVFQVNVLEGEFSDTDLEPLMEKGIILDGTGQVREEIKGPSLGAGVSKDYLRYEDLGIDSNFEERTETMYKTIVTDTSFVRVPVDRIITEKKSPAMKAGEAAEFILELRTRRFELLTGEYAGIPQGEAMSAALAKLDELEASYISLFTGKNLCRTERKAWFIVPETGTGSSDYPLGMFSEQFGFVLEELKEGIPLLVHMEPLGKTRDMGAYYAGKTGEAGNNKIFYRLPDVVELNVRLGNTELCKQRISVYQSGALINTPIR
jgi:hypothetical protein